MRRPSGKRFWAGAALIIAFAAILIFYILAGFLDRDPLEFFGVHGSRPRYAAVLFSGDMGLRVGMGAYTAKALNRVGVPVLGISSSTEFATHKSRSEVDAIVAHGAEGALARTHARQLILVGQSFGADILRVGLVHFPADLRNKVAAVVLVVPGQNAFFHADPTTIAYRRAPDAGPGEALRIGWTPVLCIRGAEETDSLCPWLKNANVRSITLPGGHLLHRDHALLTRTMLAGLRPMLAGALA